MKNEEKIIELLLELKQKQNAFDGSFGVQLDRFESRLDSIENTISNRLDRIEGAVAEVVKETDKQTQVIKRLSDKIERIYT